jgi:hypothetical protein
MVHRVLEATGLLDIFTTAPAAPKRRLLCTADGGNSMGSRSHPMSTAVAGNRPSAATHMI